MRALGKIKSLTARIILLSSLWTIIAIALLGWLLLAQFRQGAERNFDDLQQAQIFSLIGAINLNEYDAFSGAPNLGDQGFLIPNSGWFWRVENISAATKNVLVSPSFADTNLVRPSLEKLPYDDQFSRSYVTDVSIGSRVRVLEAEVDLGDNQIVLFQIGGNQSEFDSDIQNLALRIAAVLSVFGLGVVLINVFILLFGLRPLDRIREALSDIRAGKSEKLNGDFPSEIAPMVSEMNVLIDNNKRVVERARTQVGNLAHSLKTPLAVLHNETRANKAVDAKIVSTQAENMQTQVQHYLNRARIAAQKGSLGFRTDVKFSTERLVKVMAKLNPHLDVHLDIDADEIIFAGEKEDFEEILGNLVENACKWGKSKVQISLSGPASTNNAQGNLTLRVEDDGTGIDKSGYAAALKRGQRLDEKVPGTGLGLSIVSDTVAAYDGDIDLSRSQLGGLSVKISLPHAILT